MNKKPTYEELEQRIRELEKEALGCKRAEEALQESENRFRTLVEKSVEAIFLVNFDMEIVFWNRAAEEMIGLRTTPTKKITLSDVLTPDSLKIAMANVARASKTGTTRPRPYELTIRKSDGILADLEVFIGLVEYDGKPHMLGTARDITERKRMEEELRFLSSIAKQVIDPIIVTNMNFEIIYINKAAEELYGYSQEELIGKSPGILNAEQIADQIQEDIYKTVSSGKVWIGEHFNKRKDGSTFICEFKISPLVDEQGLTSAYIAIQRDITKRKQADETLQESEEKYRSLVESTEDFIYLLDRNCEYLFMNKKHLTRLSLAPKKAIGRTYAEFHSEDDTKDFIGKAEKVFETGKSLYYEYRSQRDGRYYLRTLSPVKKTDGSSKAIIVVSKEITERKQAEEVLREKEAFNFALFQYNPMETIVVDLEGRVTSFNLAKKNSGERLPNIGDVMYKDYAGKHEIDMYAELMKCIRSGKTRRFPERKYGDKLLSITVSPFYKGAIITSEDITKRVQAEEALKQKTEQQDVLLSSISAFIYYKDTESNLVAANKAFAEMVNVPIDQLVGKNAYDLFPKEQAEAFHADDKKVMSSGRPIMNIEEEFTDANGKTRWASTSKTPYFDEKGKVAGMVGITTDITDRKRAEEALRESEEFSSSLLNNSPNPMLVINPDTSVKYVNPVLEKLTEFSSAELIGSKAPYPWWTEETLKKTSRDLKEAMRKGAQRLEELFQKKNRERFWVEITSTPVRSNGEFKYYLANWVDITERKRAEEELKNSREQLRNLASYLQSVRETERTTVAREIHDELAQALTALKMDISWLGKKLPKDQKTLLDKTKAMTKLTDTTIKMVKRISTDLRPGLLDDLGLIAAIEWQAEEFKNRTGITYKLTIDPEDFIVDPDRSTAIFRIFQETLTNIARHAKATRVTASLKEKDGTLELKVIDNGKGITKKQISDPESFGLIGIRERVHPWGGEVKIKGVSGEGTEVTVRIPVEKISRKGAKDANLIKNNN